MRSANPSDGEFQPPPPRRAEALAAIGPDWNPTWSPECQRHHAALREMTAEKTVFVHIEPGVTVHGMDPGT
ncbi:hypothetical protein AB0N09_40420 [Streptomyces erythrochromogenes]|uniref:hypothetical protein n=1 Tax=Streptomyces erythrochromogenes TaxID=285574 RepID=UPI00342BC99B